MTERVLREVRAIERARTDPIGSEVPGEERFLDTFSVGHLKGVGKVWRLSAVDGASFFGIARVVAGDKTAAVMARFLAEDVVPACQRAGLTRGTATTDNGPEFGRAFGETCRLTGPAGTWAARVRVRPARPRGGGYLGSLCQRGGVCTASRSISRLTFFRARDARPEGRARPDDTGGGRPVNEAVWYGLAAVGSAAGPPVRRAAKEAR